MNEIVAKMVIKLHADSCRLRKRRDDEHGPHLQRCVSHFLPEVSQIVLVSTSDFLDQAMHPETLEHSGDLGSGFVRHDGAKRTILKSSDVKFSTNNSLKHLQIFAVEEIEPAIGPLAIRSRFRDFFKVLDPHGRIFDLGDEFQVTSVRCFHQFPKNGKTVDGFLQHGILHFPGAIPVFHLPAVFKKAYIVDRRLNTQNDPQFVIHLNRHGSHVMIDPGPFDSGMKIIAHLSLIGPVKLPSQEGCDLLGFDRVNCRTDDPFVQGTKVALIFENHIRSELNLHQGPMITRWEMPDHGTIHLGHLIQSPMKHFDLEAIGDLLGLREILHFDEGIVQKTVGELLAPKETCQQMMSVKIELQPEGSPGRHPQITQPQIFKDEVEIVVDALGFRASEKGLARLLVMPRLERRTGLQGGEDMDQSRMIATILDDLLDAILLTEILLSNKFDLQTILLGQFFRTETNFVPQGFCEPGIIEDADALGSQVATHRFGIADIGKGPRDDYPIKTGKDSPNFAGISFCQCGHGFDSLRDAQKDSLCLYEEQEKINPCVVSRCSITPASLDSPFLGRGRECGEMSNLSPFYIAQSINLQTPCLVPAMPG